MVNKLKGASPFFLLRTMASGFRTPLYNWLFDLLTKSPQPVKYMMSPASSPLALTQFRALSTAVHPNDPQLLCQVYYK